MTGWRLTSSMPAMMRSLSSFFEATRMWRRTERANLEKNPSMRLSHEPCLGVKVSSKRPTGRLASQAMVSLEMHADCLSRITLFRSVRRIGGIDKPEKLDEISTAVALPDERVDLAGE